MNGNPIKFVQLMEQFYRVQCCLKDRWRQFETQHFSLKLNWYLLSGSDVLLYFVDRGLIMYEVSCSIELNWYFLSQDLMYCYVCDCVNIITALKMRCPLLEKWVNIFVLIWFWYEFSLVRIGYYYFKMMTQIAVYDVMSSVWSQKGIS